MPRKKTSSRISVPLCLLVSSTYHYNITFLKLLRVIAVELSDGKGSELPIEDKNENDNDEEKLVFRHAASMI
jgi:hypothetical protein